MRLTKEVLPGEKLQQQAPAFQQQKVPAGFPIKPKQSTWNAAKKPSEGTATFKPGRTNGGILGKGGKNVNPTYNTY